MRAKVKQEKADYVFKTLKRRPIGEIIDLDFPSPVKRCRSAAAVAAPPNPSTLPGLNMEEDDLFPAVGQEDDLEKALEWRWTI